MDEVEKIRQKVDIVALISEYLPLKKTGRNFRINCPFHSEKTPSFTVSPERQIFHCFGCNVGGDIFTFLMKYENLEFVEALRTLAKRAGVTLSARHLATEGTVKKKERLYEINHLAAEFYHYLLTKHSMGTRALEYLRNRGINDSSIEYFKLGFAPTLSRGLISFLVDKKGFNIQELEEAGLVIRVKGEGDRVGSYVDRFRDRIMFPLADHRGNMVGFSGRILTPRENVGKYVNTPETLIYHKGELLYGLDKNREAIKKEGFVILVEGEFDVIQCRIHGILNMLAVKGTAVTEGQVSLLKRFTDKVSICLDADQAGTAAQWRSIPLLEEKEIAVSVVEVPFGKDADESLRQNSRDFKQAVVRKIPVYDFLIKSSLERFDAKTAEGKKKISDDVLPFFTRIQNEIIKDHYVKKLAEALSSSTEAILREMDRVKKTNEVGFTSKTSLSKQPLNRPRQEVLEEYLLALILQASEVSAAFQAAEKILNQFLQTPIYQKIWRELQAFLGKKSEFSIKKFIKACPEELHFAIDRCYLLNIALPGRGLDSAVSQESEDKYLLEIEKTATEAKALFLKAQMRNLTVKIREQEHAVLDEQKLVKLKREFNALIESLRFLTITTLPVASDSSTPAAKA